MNETNQQSYIEKSRGFSCALLQTNNPPSNANAPAAICANIRSKFDYSLGQISVKPNSEYNEKVLLFREGLCGGAYRDSIPTTS